MAIRYAAVALLALATACGTRTEPSGHTTIERVADGDSLVVTGAERIRLLQIDAPELGQGECYGREATRELGRLVKPGDAVELENDRGLDDVDRHGRLLRYVLREGVNVNVELVRRGAATPFFLGGERGRYAAELLGAVEDARRADAGMWASCSVRWHPERQVETRPR
jgi:endonuclease YncB( thermonuclease family)